MGGALVLLLVGVGSIAAGVLIGRYYVPDDRQLRRTARHSRSYMRALSYLISRDHGAVIDELRGVVDENIEDVEPYFVLAAMFRSRGEHERAIRVHQALAVRERDRRKVRQRAMYELGLDFRAAGMPRRATRAMEQVLHEDPDHEGALRALAALYEEQARFNEAAGLWQRLGRRRPRVTDPNGPALGPERGADLSAREHHLLVAAAQAALGRDDLESAKHLLKQAQKLQETAHFFAAAAELAAARGNYSGATTRLKQALIADPALAPHLLPGLIAAEEGSDEVKPRSGSKRDDLDDDGIERTPVPALETGSAGLLTAGSRGDSTALTGAAKSEQDAVTAENGSDSTALTVAASNELAAATASSAALATPDGSGHAITKPITPAVGVPLVPDTKPVGTDSERVLAVLAEVEAQTGPRLELALIRAQLTSAASRSDREAIATELATKFPDALAARVAAARLALESGDERAVRQALDVIAGEQGALAWALRGRWQCSHCGNRPTSFSWRCGGCRRWSSLRMETGVEPPPVAPRDRRASPRGSRPEGLLGVTPDTSLPAPMLDPGLSEEELARAGARRSLLGRVGGWFSGVWRRTP